MIAPSPLSASGGVAEWSIAPVLKTGNGQPFVSSNLTASAIENKEQRASAKRYAFNKQQKAPVSGGFCFWRHDAHR